MMKKNINFEKKSLLGLSCLITTLLLNGCADPAFGTGDSAFKNHLSYGDSHYQVDYKKGQNLLTENQKKNLQKKLAPMNHVESVFISECSTTGNTQLAKQHVAEVEKIIMHSGLSATSVKAPAKSNINAQDCVRLTMRKSYLTPPTCPDIGKVGSDYSHISSNFGCSTERNLGLMIANPKDLDPSYGLDNIRTESQVHGVERYNNGGRITINDDSTTSVVNNSGTQ